MTNALKDSASILDLLKGTKSTNFCVEVCTLPNLTDAIFVMRDTLVDLSKNLATLQISLLVLTVVIGLTMFSMCFLGVWVVFCTETFKKSGKVERVGRSKRLENDNEPDVVD